MHWKDYQHKMMARLKSLGKSLTISGDGRHDSMGHSAKYCAYTIFCEENSKILHFSLVQVLNASAHPAIDWNKAETYIIHKYLSTHIFVNLQRNETNSSPAMEYMAFQRGFDHLERNGLSVATFTSDRHASIKKHMREKLSHINHYFDLWHLAKSEFSMKINKY